MPTTTQETKLPDIAVMYNDRTTLANRMEQYWEGRRESVVGLQYVTLKDGIVRSRGFAIERRDILFLQDSKAGVNIFIEPNGDVSVQPWENGTLTDVDIEFYRAAAKWVYQAEEAYVARQLQFFEEQPWKLAFDKPVAKAIKAMRDAGW
jgi:hypothetical protein